MYPTAYDYHQAQMERLAVAFSPYFPPSQPIVPKMYVAKGESIFSGHEVEAQAYLVTSGEVLILRNGLPVDLVEEGEVLDLALWPGTVAMALSACTLTVSAAMQPAELL